MSLKAIARILDDKIENRDDRLLGQVRAIVGQGSPTAADSPTQPKSGEKLQNSLTHLSSIKGSGIMASLSSRIMISRLGISVCRRSLHSSL